MNERVISLADFLRLFQERRIDPHYYPEELTGIFNVVCERLVRATSKGEQKRQQQEAVAMVAVLNFEGFLVAVVDLATHRADAASGGRADAGAGCIAGADAAQWGVSYKSALSAKQPAAAPLGQALNELMRFDLGVQFS